MKETKTHEQNLKELNQWLSEIKDEVEELEFVDINDNEFTRWKNKFPDSKLKTLKVYPEHFDVFGIGSEITEGMPKTINEKFYLFENVEVFRKLFTEDEIKKYFDVENYMFLKTYSIVDDFMKHKKLKEKQQQIHALKIQQEDIQKQIDKLEGKQQKPSSPENILEELKRTLKPLR